MIKSSIVDIISPTITAYCPNGFFDKVILPLYDLPVLFHYPQGHSFREVLVFFPKPLDSSPSSMILSHSPNASFNSGGIDELMASVISSASLSWPVLLQEPYHTQTPLHPQTGIYPGRTLSVPICSISDGGCRSPIWMSIQ